MGVLRELGIIGWDAIEPVILAALMRRRSILFVGMHGTNKTEAPRTLAEALLPEGSQYTPYDTPLLSTDDLLGLINPKTLGNKDEKGNDVVDFIRTPNSVWGSDAILLDEPNRANASIAGKVMELIRTRRVMGRKTNIKYVFGAANPPKEYDSIFMDLAFASRFMIVQVPGTNDLSRDDMDEILTIGIRGVDKKKRADGAIKLHDGLARARRIKFDEANETEAKNFTHKLLEEFRNIKDLKISPRQAQSIASTFLDIGRLQQVNLLQKNIKSQDKAEVIMSFVPEAHGIVRKQVQRSTLLTIISQVLTQFELKEGAGPADLHSLLKVKSDDGDTWASAVADAIKVERNTDNVRKAARISRSRLRKKLITSSAMNAIVETAIKRILEVDREDAVSDDIKRAKVRWNKGGLKKMFGDLIAKREDVE